MWSGWVGLDGPGPELGSPAELAGGRPPVRGIRGRASPACAIARVQGGHSQAMAVRKRLKYCTTAKMRAWKLPIVVRTESMYVGMRTPSMTVTSPSRCEVYRVIAAKASMTMRPPIQPIAAMEYGRDRIPAPAGWWRVRPSGGGRRQAAVPEQGEESGSPRGAETGDTFGRLSSPYTPWRLVAPGGRPDAPSQDAHRLRP